MADRTIRVRLQADINGYVANLKQASSATAEFGRSITGHGDASRASIEKLGTASLVAGGAIAVAFGAAVGSAMKFDQQLSELSAVSSATAEEMSALRQAALDAGAATAFSASEAAQAQTELAKAGVTTADIMGGALTGALDLAAAGGLELAEAATYAANAMTTFGLTGSDVSHIADVLAAGANKSAADVSDLGTALQQSGLVADQFGLTLDDSVGVLAAFAQAGLRGSDAGTSFKTMLQRLTPQSAEAAEKMEELGIDMFDASGQFIGIEAAAGELQEALSGLTQEQRNTALATIFGSDAVRGATILYEEGAAGIGEWITQVNDAGFAGDVAAKRLDNLAGDLEALRGSIETALIEGGSHATDALRFLTQSATDAVNIFSEMPGPVQAILTGLTGLAGGGLLVVGAIGTMVPKVQAAREALVQMGDAGTKANTMLGKLGRAGGAAAGIAALTGVLVPLTEAIEGFIKDKAPDLDEMGLALVEFGRSGEVTGELLDKFGGDLHQLVDDLDLLREGRPIDIFQDEREAVERIDAIDKALANLVDSGHALEAEEILAGLTSGLSDDDIRLFENKLGDYSDAVARADTQTALAAEGVEGSTAQIGAAAEQGFAEAEQAAQDAADAVDAYRTALRGATDPLFALLDAERGHADAQRGITEAQQAAIDATARLNEVRADPEASARDIERAERDVEEAFRGIEDAHLAVYDSAFEVEQAQADLAESMANGTTTIEAAREALERLASEGLLTPAEVAAMLGPFDDLITRVSILDNFDDINLIINGDPTGALNAIQMVMTAYGQMPQFVEGNFIGPLAPGQSRLPGYNQYPNKTGPYQTFAGPGYGSFTDGRTGNAGGGWAGTNSWGPTDRIPSLLSPGEFILNAGAAAQFSDAQLYDLNRGVMPAGGGDPRDLAAMVGAASGPSLTQQFYGKTDAAVAGEVGFREMRRLQMVGRT